MAAKRALQGCTLRSCSLPENRFEKAPIGPQNCGSHRARPTAFPAVAPAGVTVSLSAADFLNEFRDSPRMQRKTGYQFRSLMNPNRVLKVTFQYTR
jgi:hypothetical protein